MDLSSFYNQFREETAENIRILSDGLIALERIPGTDNPEAQDQINTIFRAMHTIKGSARLLGFETIARLAHAMENTLGAVRAGLPVIHRALADELLRSGDAILELTSAAIDGHPTSIDVDQLIVTLEKSTSPRETGAPDSTEAGPTGGLTAEIITTTSHTPEMTPSLTPRLLPASSPTSTQAPSKGRQTVRVRVDRLDRLINLTGELVVGQQVVTTHSHALHALTRLIQQQERALRDLEAELHHLHVSSGERHILEDRIQALLNSGNQMRQILATQSEQFNQHVSQQRLLVGALEQEVMTARLLPIATVFTTMPRAVRELSRATNKDVILEIYGETTEIDRKLIENLYDPLLHLIRNAVDHGIESPDERVVRGKPRQGRISISAEAAGGDVHICIRDDGRGMDPANLRDLAVQKGLLSSEQAALLSDQEALELIFLPGFSTTSIITDISGRGVGMDVVRTNISELGGQVLINSQPGLGTNVTLLLPLTLVTTRILLVKAGNYTFAFPASGCRGTTWVYRSDIRTIEGRAHLFYKEQTLPVLHLADLLDIDTEPAFQRQERMPIVLVGSTQRFIGLVVDQLLDEREAVVKSLGPLFERRQRYSGAVQLGDGQLVLLLNPTVLSQTVHNLERATPTVALTNTRPSHLLVADDSFTTRELIRSILQSAGYTVTAAVDGLDAIEKLRTHVFDLVISDVEMPHLDGFQLTKRIRHELKLHDLPVIIITSLASDELRRQGLEAGAQAYIVKSQFNQDTLLGVVQQLLGT